MRDVNPSDIDTMISMKGMVTRTSGIIPEMVGAVFGCEVNNIHNPVNIPRVCRN